ncbi:MAG TPA: palindromic element RPE4 domain-containing protein [Rickettsia endosymbiont of Columbicola hoogstraali]|nr:palindromic element RPE4 domain-containing protein [Rickettsia endosymbiont of Columbicola hoogstraali]
MDLSRFFLDLVPKPRYDIDGDF